jgi:hypothetical protein
MRDCGKSAGLLIKKKIQLIILEMKITALTTACYRPEAWKFAEYYMKRQTLQPHQWIVLDDDDPPTKCTMGQQYVHNSDWKGSLSLLNKIKHAIQNNLITGEAVAFWENDDWMAPTWLKFCSDQLEKYDMIGEGDAIYHNVRHRYWIQFHNMRHSSLCSTAIRVSQLQKVLELCDTSTNKDPFLDQRIWLDNDGIQCSKKVFAPEGDRLVIGIKGMPGRTGYNVGHGQWANGATSDKSLIKLRSLIGDDVKLYEPFYIP